MVALGLGACAGRGPDGTGHPGGHTESRLAPTQSVVQHDVRFAASGGHLAPGEDARLRDRLSSLGLSDQDDLILAIPPSGSGSLDRDREQALRLALADIEARIRVADSVPEFPSASTRRDMGMVQAVRYGATVDGCPDWSRSRTGDVTKTRSSNYGCARAHNLAGMISQPRDLIHGRDAGPADGVRAVRAIERYHLGEDGEDMPEPGRFVITD